MSRMRSIAKMIFVLVVGSWSCVALSNEFDIRGVNFKRARPYAGDSLGKSVVEPSADSMAILEQDVAALKRFPNLRVKIVGFTDNQECSRSECIIFSLRRAKYVRDWFLDHGILNQQVAGPEGLGDAMQIDSNDTALSRTRNRRAEVQALTFPNGDSVNPSTDGKLYISLERS